MRAMPNHEEHCLHSLERYGVRGDDIHSWIDEPSQIAGSSHRKYRHDLNSLPIAIQMFGEKYGDELVETIFLDHLKADSEEARQPIEKEEGHVPSPSFEDNLPKQPYMGINLAKFVYCLGLVIGLSNLAVFFFFVFDSGINGFIVRQNWYVFVGWSVVS